MGLGQRVLSCSSSRQDVKKFLNFLGNQNFEWKKVVFWLSKFKFQ